MGTEASAVRALGRAATSYICKRVKDFHKLIRQRKGSCGTTLPSGADRGRVWAVEVGATVRGSGEYVSAFAKGTTKRNKLRQPH